MDSLTQIVLGGSVGVTILKDKPRTAILWGGLLATIPDLDTLLSRFYDPILFFSVHRSFSHSFLFSFGLSFIVAWLISRFGKVPYKKAYLFSFMVLVTHILLDLFTAYGTQLFWPFTNEPYTLQSISVVDPLYTAPLLIGMAYAFIVGNQRKQKALRVVKFGLILSTLYLAWSLIAQTLVTRHVAQYLQKQEIEYSEI